MLRRLKNEKVRESNIADGKEILMKMIRCVIIPFVSFKDQ